MNVSHLGDALDFWKGALIDMLGDHLRNIHVLPMFTDKDVATTWTQERLQVYARLLRVDHTRILRSGERFFGGRQKRADYFRDIGVESDEDVFVDPDTGVEPKSGGNCRHIRLVELAELVPNGSKRIVMVYQHSQRDKIWVSATVERIVACTHLGGCHAFAYGAGSVAMLFVSRDSQRLTLLHSTLTDLTASLPTDVRRVTPIRGGELPHHPGMHRR